MAQQNDPLPRLPLELMYKIVEQRLEMDFDCFSRSYVSSAMAIAMTSKLLADHVSKLTKQFKEAAKAAHYEAWGQLEARTHNANVTVYEFDMIERGLAMLHLWDDAERVMRNLKLRRTCSRALMVPMRKYHTE